MVRPRAALVAATLAFVLVTTGLLAAFVVTPALAHSSTITVLDGQVLVRRGLGGYEAIADGDVVVGGDSVRTGAASHGVLTFFDGSTIELEPETELTLTTLQASASGDKVIDLTQTFGRTWHVVTHLASASSRYEIRTNASTAQVRGTAFQVAVLPDGSTQTTTTDGDVVVSAQGREVHVRAGQQTTVTPGSPPVGPRSGPVSGATVRVTVPLTADAIVTDANGRAAGLQNGRPVRYIPGSTVEVAGTMLVVTIPNAQLGVLSTTIRPEPGPGGRSSDTVTVRAQVTVADVGVLADSLTSRPVLAGVAKDAVVLTDRGLLLLSDADAKNAPDPRIGQAPTAPAHLVQLGPSATFAPAPTVVVSAPESPGDGSPALVLEGAAFVPFSRREAPPAGSRSQPVNVGVVPVTGPITAVFASPATPASPPVTVPPQIVPPPTPVAGLTPGGFASPTPAPLAPIAVPSATPPAGAAVPTLTSIVAPAPTATRSPIVSVPTITPVPSLVPTATPSPTVAVTPAPTFAPTATSSPSLAATICVPTLVTVCLP